MLLQSFGWLDTLLDSGCEKNCCLCQLRNQSRRRQTAVYLFCLCVSVVYVNISNNTNNNVIGNCSVYCCWYTLARKIVEANLVSEYGRTMHKCSPNYS